MDACTENLEVVVDLAIPYKIVKRRFIHSRHFQREIVRTWRRYKHVSLLSVNKFILPLYRLESSIFYSTFYYFTKEEGKNSTTNLAVETYICTRMSNLSFYP